MTNAEKYFGERATEAIAACKESAKHWMRMAKDAQKLYEEKDEEPCSDDCACCQFDAQQSCPLVSYITRGESNQCDNCNHESNPYFQAQREWDNTIDGLTRSNKQMLRMRKVLLDAAKWLAKESISTGKNG